MQAASGRYETSNGCRLPPAMAANWAAISFAPTTPGLSAGGSGKCHAGRPDHGVLTFFRDMGSMSTYTTTEATDFPGGKSRLKAIGIRLSGDRRRLNAQGYGRRYLYGMSMGGVILTQCHRSKRGV